MNAIVPPETPGMMSAIPMQKPFISRPKESLCFLRVILLRELMAATNEQIYVIRRHIWCYSMTQIQDVTTAMAKIVQGISNRLSDCVRMP